MPAVLPVSTLDMLDWDWEDYAPFFADLQSRSPATDPTGWLRDWSRLSSYAQEVYARIYVATTSDTADKVAEQRYQAYLRDVYPRAMEAEQELRQAWIAAGCEVAGFDVPLRNMRAEIELFREANLPLLSEETRLGNEYNKIIGAQTIEWQGRELTIPQLQPIYQEPDRELREQAWHAASARQFADRAAINANWQQMMELRAQIAANAQMADYRAYSWQRLLRFDYSPDDCETFQQAIETVVVPAAQRVYERRRERLGLSALRPWDLSVDPLGRPPLRPFEDVGQLEARCGQVLAAVDAELGDYFAVMRREKLLDLANRKGKAPGGYCIGLPVVQRPFIFMNAVGVADNVRTVLHEAGHAFHVFEKRPLPYRQQHSVPMEFAEVASMAMELLASPYLSAAAGGFYDEADAARARIEHLEHILLFWPYMAVVDAFQHWVYTNHAAASDPANCDATWFALWQRFMPGVDWGGLDDIVATGWQRKQHIHRRPFYYVEYGLAQLGAVQVWQAARDDQAAAVAAYRQSLALGGTATLPELYAAAAARFAFDADTLGAAVHLIETTIAELETATAT